jgi:hypothetical protein
MQLQNQDQPAVIDYIIKLINNYKKETTFMDHNVPTVITLSFFPMSTAVAILSMCGEQNLKADRPTHSLRAVCGPVFPPQIRFVRAAVCDQASGIDCGF